MEINNELLNKACIISKKGSNEAKKLKNNVEKEQKDNKTIVTEADKKVEKIIRKELKNKTQYPITGEEYGGEFENKNTG
jgi:fructose-1,6-bisphosphatase/inositol monophosphatase family enzyme